MTLTMTRLKPLLLIVLAIEALTIAASGSQRLADSLCLSKKDGHYALGICSPDYLTCSNGTSFAHHCKFGLFFDKAREQCSDRRVIADCQAPFDCLDRDDGIYSDGCSQKFWYCFGGSAASSSCQPGLYFNAETKTCEYFKSIKACKGKCNQKTPVGDTCSDHYFVCIDQIPTRQTCKKHEAYDDYYRKCRNLNELPQCILNQIHRELNTIIENNEVQQPLDTLDNYVPVPYPGTFQSDRFHATYPTYTPPTTTSVYAVEGSGEEINIDFNGVQRMSRFSSDNSEQIIATIMRNSGGSLHANVDIPGNLIRVGDLPDNKSKYVGSVESLVPTFCLDRRDGNFFVSCGTKFINCINHASTVKTCPDDLVFSEDINACVFVNDVPLCANSVLKANDSVKPIEVKEQKLSTERLVSNIKSGKALDVICQKNRDLNPLLGLSPCSPYFIACKNEAVVVAACDKHFLFNEKTQQCETPYETFCSQKLPADAEQICQTVENPPFIDTPLIKASCAEHSVRAFEECADVYYVCHDQTLLRRDCPEGLRFDLAVGACVAHCGDSQYIKELVGSPYDKFCENQGPSKHGLGCTSVYVECSPNGVSSVHECENGFVFNNNIQGCALYCESTPVGLLNKLFKPLIFKSKTNSQSSNVVDQDKNPKYIENYRGFNQVTLDTEYRQLDAKTFCSEHDDGAHSIGCSNTFYSCFNGHGVLLHCQDELVFNAKLGACTLSCDQDQPQIAINPMPQKTSLCPFGYIGFLPISQCSEVFIHCKNGVEYKQACPGRHFFNVHLHSCHRSCDAPIGSDTNNVKSDVESIAIDQDVTKKAKPTFQDIRNFRLQPPSTFITDGFSQNPVYIQRVPVPLKTDQFSGVPELSSPVRVPFTPNNVPGRITFDAFDRRGYPYSGRMVYSPFPQFHNVENNDPDPKPLPAVSPPPLLPRPQSYKTINILPPVLPRKRASLKKPVSAIMESAEILDLLSKNDTSRPDESAEILDLLSKNDISHPNESAEVPADEVSVEGSGASIEEEDIETEATFLWRKKREITTQCQYKRHWYNPNIALIESYDFVPNVECTAGKTPLGCTGSYIECINGKPHVFSCPDNFIYDKQTMKCILNNNLKCTLGSTVLESKHSRNRVGESMNVFLNRHTIENLREVVENVPRVSDPRCAFGAQGAVSLGFCLSEFLLCLPNGQSSRTYCLNNQLFDHGSSKCVPAVDCGQNIQAVRSISAPQPSLSRFGLANTQCSGRENGEVISTGKCLSSYIRCVKGEPIRSVCLKLGEAFSPRHKACVSISLLPECGGSTAVNRNLSLSNGPNICVNHPDGYYRHPESCQRIIQCFGHETIEHPPCQHDLAFDSARGVCDYRRNVPGCDNAPKFSSRTDTVIDVTANSPCNERSHGDYLPNKSDCSTYFRCVWGRFETMKCPEGTAFNTNLGVCDYLDQIPECMSNR